MSNSQKPRRHASLAARSHSSPRELHDARHGTHDEHQPECYTIDAHGPDDSSRLIAACLGLVSILLVLSHTRLRSSALLMHPTNKRLSSTSGSPPGTWEMLRNIGELRR